MAIYRIPREHAWIFRNEIRRASKSARFVVNTSEAFDTVDGVLYEFEDYEILFERTQSDGAGYVVGSSRDGVLDVFEGETFEFSDVIKECPVCESQSMHKRMLIAESGVDYKFVHPKCSELKDPAIFTRDLARNVESPTERSRAYAVTQLLRISLLVSGPGAKGFASRAKSNDATSDKVLALLNGTNAELYEPYPELEDELEETLELARQLSNGGDWASKVKKNASREHTSEVGLTCSMLALLRSKRKEQAAPKGFIEAYELADLELTLTSVTHDTEYWGYSPTSVSKLEFLASDGRHVSWRTSGALDLFEGVKPGAEFILDHAILKKHSTWRGRDTTEIKRPKFHVKS